MRTVKVRESDRVRINEIGLKHPIKGKALPSWLVVQRILDQAAGEVPPPQDQVKTPIEETFLDSLTVFFANQDDISRAHYANLLGVSSKQVSEFLKVRDQVARLRSRRRG